MYRHILIATDGSKPSVKAVNHGVKLAKSVGAQVTIMTATELWSAVAMSAGIEAGIANPIEDYEKTVAESAKRTLAAASKVAEKAELAVKTEHVPDRRASEAIVETARKRRCDLIVVGSHGRRGLDRMLIGSQAYEVVTQSKVPVLVVR